MYSREEHGEFLTQRAARILRQYAPEALSSAAPDEARSEIAGALPTDSEILLIYWRDAELWTCLTTSMLFTKSDRAVGSINLADVHTGYAWGNEDRMRGEKEDLRWFRYEPGGPWFWAPTAERSSLLLSLLQYATYKNVSRP